MRLRGGLFAFLAIATSACAAPAGSPASYPRHQDVVATVFWVGEPATEDNDYVSNFASAWDDRWQEHFGGVDDPAHRQQGGDWPAGFQPRENPYYLALPYGEYAEDGSLRPDANRIYWYGERKPGQSLLRGHWARISRQDRTAYAQWADVGPFRTDDVEYVFGTAQPAEPRAGIDLSPATAHYLRLSGRATVSWQFVAAGDVPPGPWTRIVTAAGPTGGG